MPYIDFWQIGIDQIDDTVTRLLAAIDQIEPLAADALDRFDGSSMSDEEQELLHDYAADQGFMAREAVASAKQSVAVVIQSYLENWLKTIWKHTRETEVPDNLRRKTTLDSILLKLGHSEDELPKILGYADANECWRVANIVKHGLDPKKPKVNVVLTDGMVVQISPGFDYSKLRFNDYSAAVAQLLTATAQYATKSRPVKTND